MTYSRIAIASVVTLSLGAVACGGPADVAAPAAQEPIEAMGEAVVAVELLSAEHSGASALVPSTHDELDYIETTSLLVADAEAQLEALEPCKGTAAGPFVMRLDFILKDLGVEFVSHFVDASHVLDGLTSNADALATLTHEENRHQMELTRLYDEWTAHMQDAVIQVRAIGCVSPDWHPAM